MFLRLHSSTAFQTLVDYDGYSISSKGFLPIEVDTSELNSPIPVHFSSLNPKMSMFTLAISCLVTSNLPSLMDLTFQVPMLYCSLQHWLFSPVTSTTGYCFCFGSISSFFLELLLQKHFGHLLTWRIYPSVSYIFSFSFCSSGSQGKNNEVVCHSLLQWTMFCQNPPVTHPCKLLSCVHLYATPCTIAHQAPLSMGFSRQEYWSGLPFSSPPSLQKKNAECTN